VISEKLAKKMSSLTSTPEEKMVYIEKVLPSLDKQYQISVIKDSQITKKYLQSGGASLLVSLDDLPAEELERLFTNTKKQIDILKLRN
jgi:hypothetical protein